MRGWILSVFFVISSAAAADVSVGTAAPELDVARNEAGQPVTLASLRPRWVVMTIGASWCKPCAAELPALDALASKLKRSDLQFIALNLDNDSKKGRAFFDKLKIRQLLRVYLPASQSKTADALETGTFPSTFVIDPTGVIRHVHLGYRKGDDALLAGTLARLLPTTP